METDENSCQNVGGCSLVVLSFGTKEVATKWNVWKEKKTPTDFTYKKMFIQRGKKI